MNTLLKKIRETLFLIVALTFLLFCNVATGIRVLAIYSLQSLLLSSAVAILYTTIYQRVLVLSRNVCR